MSHFGVSAFIAFALLYVSVSLYVNYRNERLSQLFVKDVKELASIPLEISRTVVVRPTGSCLQGRECLHVVLAADGPYLTPLLACINSVIVHTTQQTFFHLIVKPGESDIFSTALLQYAQLLSVGPQESNRSVGFELVEFNPNRVKPLIRVWKGLHMHSDPFNFARFYMPNLFPEVSEVIYLDPDIIVKADLQSVLKFFRRRESPSTTILAAVPSKKERPTRKNTYGFLLNCLDPEIAAVIKQPKTQYFNAGVLVTDLALWRQYNITAQLEVWMHRNTQRKLWKWGSQAPLALVFYEKWMALDYSWNERRTKYDHFSLEHDGPGVKIYHFTGEEKPWKSNGGSKLWSIWCPYYVHANKLWFCNANGASKLIPQCVTDFSLLFKTEDQVLYL